MAPTQWARGPDATDASKRGRRCAASADSWLPLGCHHATAVENENFMAQKLHLTPEGLDFLLVLAPDAPVHADVEGQHADGDGVKPVEHYRASSRFASQMSRSSSSLAGVSSGQRESFQASCAKPLASQQA